LNGEAGFQPALLRGGWHVLMPFQYRLHKMPLVTIPQGKVGYVFARDGKTLPPTQTLASNVTADDFQDVAAFLRAGGQRGPQRKILREGTYALNTAQFVVSSRTSASISWRSTATEADTFKRMAMVISERHGFEPSVIKDADDVIGIVTVHDGPSLPDGQIIAPTRGDDAAVPALYHNNFPGPGEVPAVGRPPRPPAADARRGHLLHQPAVRDGRDDSEDGHRGRQCRRRGVVHGRGRESI
jgi:uncharacterized membrane protein YqiK